MKPLKRKKFKLFHYRNGAMFEGAPTYLSGNADEIPMDQRNEHPDLDFWADGAEDVL